LAWPWCRSVVPLTVVLLTVVPIGGTMALDG
jgi:hypothetical protein